MSDNKIYFHGSTLPPGTSSKELWKPSTEKPFFVTDRLAIAEWYTNHYETWNNVKSTSIFILKTKKNLDDISFYFRNPSHLSKLAGDFPALVEVLKNELSSEHSFFNVSHNLATLLLRMFSEESTPHKFKSISKENESWWTKKTPSEVKALIQMGFIERDPVTKELFSSEQVEKIIRETHDGDEEQFVRMRRLIKAPVFDKIHRLGYLSVKEWDTTPEDNGWEYAIFDMSVFENGWSKSIEKYGVDKVLSAMEKENGRK